MSKIPAFFRKADLDPAMLGVLVAAYDKACRSLHDKGQPPLVQEIIATRIMDAAKNGERDPDLLCEAALGGALGNKAVFVR
jgi:hypothetical protein